jgi:hypothetical protein
MFDEEQFVKVLLSATRRGVVQWWRYHDWYRTSVRDIGITLCPPFGEQDEETGEYWDPPRIIFVAFNEDVGEWFSDSLLRLVTVVERMAKPWDEKEFVFPFATAEETILDALVAPKKTRGRPKKGPEIEEKLEW